MCDDNTCMVTPIWRQIGLERAISIKQAGSTLLRGNNVLNRFTSVIQSQRIQSHRTHAMHLAVALMILTLTAMSGQMNEYTAQNANQLLEDGSNDSSGVSSYIAATMAESLNLSAAQHISPDFGFNDSSLLAASEDHLTNVSSIATESISYDDIQEYTVKADDTVESIADDFNIASETIRWANDLTTSEEVSEGDTIVVLPMNGVLHEVKSDDTPESLAEHYESNSERIISFNDAEIDGLPTGEEIMVPGGILPASERPQDNTGSTYATTQQQTTQQNSVASSGFSPSYSGFNGYAPGYCTWYVANRISIPNNWGHARSWAANAQATPGWTVTNTPTAGAIAQRAGGWGGFGHVGIVEEVRGSEIVMSDMNGFAGFDSIGRGTAPASSYSYIIPE